MEAHSSPSHPTRWPPLTSPASVYSLLFFVLSILAPLTFFQISSYTLCFLLSRGLSGWEGLPFSPYLYLPDLSSIKPSQESFPWLPDLEQVPLLYPLIRHIPYPHRKLPHCSLWPCPFNVWLFVPLSHQTVSFLRAGTMAVLLALVSPAPLGMSGTL